MPTEDVDALVPQVRTYKYRIKDRSAHKALSRHAYAVNQAGGR